MVMVSSIVQSVTMSTVCDIVCVEHCHDDSELHVSSVTFYHDNSEFYDLNCY